MKLFGRAFQFIPFDGVHLVSAGMHHGGCQSFYQGALTVGQAVAIMGKFDAARTLEQHFARHGQLLTRVIVPAQPLDDGATLRLLVVKGYIERVDTGGVPGAVRGRVAALLAPLEGNRELSRGTLERQLMLASEVPGIALRSTLAPGSAAGATVLVIEAEHKSVSGFLSIDNDPVPVSYSFGLAYLPAVLRNQGLLRYVNFALDIEDAFSDRDFLEKVNFGAEMNLSLAQLRGGFKGGYPCYGLMANLFILQLEFTSWAEEAGLYAGQLEDRHYMMGVRMGI